MGDIVFISSCAGTFFALDRNTGQVRWSYDIRHDSGQYGFHGNSLVVGDEIITGTDGGHVYAFDVSTGEVRWNHPITKGASASSAVTGNIIGVGRSVLAPIAGDRLISLDAGTGKLNWSFGDAHTGTTSGTACSYLTSPAASGDRVFFGGIDGTVYGLAADSGRAVWKHSLGDSVSTDLIISGDSLYVGTARGDFFRLKTATGEITAQMKLEMIAVGLPKVLGERLVFYSNRITNPGAGQNLISLDLALSRVQWQQRSSSWSVAPRPFIWRSTLLTGNAKGEIHAFRITDGKEMRSDTLKGTIRSFGSGDSGPVIYVGTLEGMVYAYQPPNP